MTSMLNYRFLAQSPGLEIYGPFSVLNILIKTFKTKTKIKTVRWLLPLPTHSFKADPFLRKEIFTLYFFIVLKHLLHTKAYNFGEVPLNVPLS